MLKTNAAGATLKEFREADELLDRASAARSALIMSGEGLEVKPFEDFSLGLNNENTDGDLGLGGGLADLDQKTREELEEDSYDLLVPVFFR